MLGDNNRDRELQRNQLIAILLMTIIVVGWSYFFLPEPAPRETPEQTPAEVPAQQAAEGPAQSTAPDLTPPASAQKPSPPGGEDLAGLLPAAPAEPLEDTEVEFSTPNLDLVFTRIGARLKRATVILGQNGEDTTQLVPTWGEVPDAEAVYPLGLRFAQDMWGDALDQRPWTLEERTDSSARFAIEAEDVARVTKDFRAAPEPYVIEVDVRYTNLQSEPQRLGLDTGVPAVSLDWGPNISSGDEKKGVKQTVIWPAGDGLE